MVILNKTIPVALNLIFFAMHLFYIKKAPPKKAAPLTFNHSFTADHYKMQQLKDKLRA